MEMSNKISENLVKAITIVTALSISTGFLIINLYLSDYGISDYALLNAKAIYTGVVYVSVICISLMVLLYGGNDIGYKMGWYDFLINLVGKPIVLSTLFYLLFIWNGEMRDSWMRLYSSGGFSINRLSVLYYSSLVYVIYAPLYYILTVCFPAHKIFDYLLYSLSVLVFALLYSIFSSFKNVVFFFYILNIIFFMCIFVFSRKDNITKRIIGINNDIRYNAFIVGFLLLMLLATAGIYSNNIYPFMKERFGGAVLGTIKIELKNGDSFKGSLIHKDDKRFYVFDGQDKIHVFDISNVKTLKIW